MNSEHNYAKENITWVNIRFRNEDARKINKLVCERRSSRSAVLREIVVNAIEEYEKEKGVIL